MSNNIRYNVEGKVAQDLEHMLLAVFEDQHSSVSTHIKRVLGLLADWQVREHTRQVAALVPIIATDTIPEQVFIERFGVQVRQSARDVAQFFSKAMSEQERGRTQDEDHQQALRLSRLFAMAYEDVELALICVANHIATADQLDTISKQARQLYAQENEALFAPLLQMLGMWNWRQKLGDLVGFDLDPIRYPRAIAVVQQYRERQQQRYEQVQSNLLNALRIATIDCNVSLHVNPPSSIYRRARIAEREGGQFVLDTGSDVLRIDVLTPSVDDCYRVLGIIHTLWCPVSGQTILGGKLRDLIANPRFNGYRCLVTSVLSTFPSKSTSHQLIEFRIRTHEMERVNTEGIVAARLQASFTIRNAWWEQSEVRAQVLQQPTADKEHVIAVFSPIGDVHCFPVGSTVVDYAFQIHSALGPYASRFWVNGKHVSSGYRLSHGDLVSVAFNHEYPSITPAWERAACTSVARSHIRRFLHQQQRAQQDGRKLIDEALQKDLTRYQLRLSNDEIHTSLDRVVRRLRVHDLPTLYDDVRQGEITAERVSSLVIADQLVGHIVREDGQPWSPERITLAQCWISSGNKHKTCCRAAGIVPGVEIVGRMTMAHRSQPLMVVHRRDCPNAPQGADAVPLRWQSSRPMREAVELTITAWDRPKLLDEILHVVYSLYSADGQGVYLHHIDAEVPRNGSSTVKLIVDAPSFALIGLLEEQLAVLRAKGILQFYEIWQLSPGQKLLLTSGSRRKHQNPYTLQEVRSRGMFFDRTEALKRVADCIHDGESLLVLYGQRRIGKTSFLYHLRDHYVAGDTSTIPVFLDAQGISPFTTASFLHRLQDAMQQALQAQPDIAKNWNGSFPETELQQDPFWMFGSWLEQIQEQLDGCRLLVLIDEFSLAQDAWQQKRLEHDFFNQFRALMGKNPQVVFVLSVQETVYNVLAANANEDGSWGLFQRGEPIRLGLLDRESAIQLIRQPLGHIYHYDDAVVERLLELTAGYPFFVQILCRELTTALADEQRNTISLSDLDAILPDVLDHGRHYFSHFLVEVTREHLQVLAAVAHASGHANSWVTVEAVQRVLSQQAGVESTQALTDALDQLALRSVISQRETPTGRAYRIPIGLFRIWLQRNVLLRSLT